ncbi:MAG: ubiquinol-cytochrome c reductase iron-sulfur subunit [Candidatus Aminicenantaceae bacterium]
MKIKHSLITRRNFLNGLLGGWAAALMATFVVPAIKFVFPPYREPDEVILSFADFQDMEPGSVRTFPWGSKPGALKMNPDSTYTAFVAVCTHLDCNVSWQPEERKFFCACHDGWYDEEGNNIAGPPPSPMRRLEASVEEENLIIRKPGVKAQ